MIVYLAWSGDGPEPWLIGVYSSEEKAKAAIVKWVHKGKYIPSTYNIQECEVDGE